jgi:hypothetical protein
VTLDALVDAEGCERVDVVKIDAEGSEDAVIRGATKTLERDRPFLFCEVLDRPGLARAVTDALAGHGYRFFRLGRDGPKPCTDVAGGPDDNESHNYLFAHHSRVE